MMRTIIQQLFVFGCTILLIACGANIGNNNIGNDMTAPKPNPVHIKVEYVDVNKVFPQLRYPPNYTPTIGSGIYVSSVGRVGVTPLYLLNGYNKPLESLHNIKPQLYWTMTSPIQIVPQEFTNNHQNNSITFLDHDSGQDYGIAWKADNLKYKDNGILEVDWHWAEGFTNVGKRKTPFYSVGDYAVIGYDKEIAFLKFVPRFRPNDKPSIINDFSQFCALTPSDTISSINAITKLDNVEHNDYIIVGTTNGGICAYGMNNAKNKGWTNLTKFAISNGYRTSGRIEAIQFTQVENNNFIYWITNQAMVSKLKIDSISSPQAFENLSNNIKYKDVPALNLINPLTFLVDKGNNIYIGGVKGNAASPTKIYVLPVGANLWQAVALSDSNSVNSIMLALDGTTTVIGTGEISDNIFTKNTRAYYINIQQK